MLVLNDLVFIQKVLALFVKEKEKFAFTDPIVILCEGCQGKKYNPTALSYTYHGKKIVEIGLGYMTLGQTANTLSGGENQRLKLAGKLNKEGNIYILDEPAVGLHGHDVNRLSH